MENIEHNVINITSILENNSEYSKEYANYHALVIWTLRLLKEVNVRELHFKFEEPCMTMWEGEE
jgi:hypothetical protein